MAELSWPLVPESSPTSQGAAASSSGAAVPGFRDFRQSADGDIDLVNGDFVAVTGAESIRQHLRMRLRFFQGEWFLDPSAGVPYLQEILGSKNPDLSLLQSRFRTVIAETPGITSIERATVTTDNRTRQASVTFAARADATLIEETVVL